MSTERKRLRDLPLEERLRILGFSDKPPTPEELKRLEEWNKRVDETARKIGKIDISVNDLLHLSDEELDVKYGRSKPPTGESDNEDHD